MERGLTVGFTPGQGATVREISNGRGRAEEQPDQTWRRADRVACTPFGNYS